jgi:hypothetical protein
MRLRLGRRCWGRACTPMLFLVPLVLASCSWDAQQGNRGGGSTPTGTPDAGTFGAPASPNGDLAVALNTPSEYPVDAEWRSVFNASIPGLVSAMTSASSEVSRRIEACMIGKGFEYTSGRIGGDEIDGRVAGNPLKTVTLPFGYHLPPQPQIAGRTTEMTEEMAVALDG